MMDDAECWSPDVRKLEVVHVDEGVLGYRTLHLFIFKWIALMYSAQSSDACICGGLS